MRQAGKWAALLLAGSALAACGDDDAVNSAADLGNDTGVDMNAEMPIDMNDLNAANEVAEEALENAADAARPSLEDPTMAQPPDPPPVPPPPPPER